ncbi:MAG: DUF1015 domain-containing protein [Polyangiaceae bacterium]|nr:DUF1015 domain-containing protein [Polyangiaceae bacterium]
MATVRPLRGLRYAAAAGPLSALLAPPYDVLSAEDRDRLAARDPRNIVHVTLPRAPGAPGDELAPYRAGASTLDAWRRSGALVRDERPALYRYVQRFTVPGTDDRRERVSLIALLRVEPYDRGVVLPHERTFPKHKADRRRLLEATRTHVECIYGLYEDDAGEVQARVAAAPASCCVRATTEDGLEHALDVIDDPGVTAALVEALGPRRVWIADGHHRYETALAFREEVGARAQPIAEDYVLMALGSMSDPGLVLLPTHRVLQSLPLAHEEIRARLSEHLALSEVPAAELPGRLAAVRDPARAFGVVLPGVAWLGAVRDVDRAVAALGDVGSLALRSLDVSILHGLLLERALGVQGLESIAYTRDAADALARVAGGAAAAFLMNPPTVDDMRRIALGGERMPQKSTYYHPKITSGLVLWALADLDG